MPEIKLQKRIIYSGEVFASLMGRGWGCTEASNFLRDFRDADAVEVVHGRWEKSHDAFHDLVNTVCSCCRHTGAQHFKYCPNCGAKMDGGADA